jgi:hypothetical protein
MNTELEVGQTYKVNHSRKGIFTIRLDHFDQEWVTGYIVDGKAGAMLEYNEIGAGEPITFRKTFATFTKI